MAKPDKSRKDQRSELQRVVELHLAGGLPTPALRRAVRDGLQRILAFAGRHVDPREHDQYALELAELLGITTSSARDEFADAVRHAREMEVATEDAYPIAEAYARGVGRVVEAEAAYIHELLRAGSEESRPELLDSFLASLLPGAAHGFDLLHRAFLHGALADEQFLENLDSSRETWTTVALVDLSGSTRHLESAETGDIEAMVDGLFEAGQKAVVGRRVRIIKYVGDGFFLVGRGPAETVHACFAALDEIDERLPLRARAGLASGELVRRAGDYFGYPVNLAQLVTKVAEPGTVLATREFASGLPPSMRGDSRTVAIAGRNEQLAVTYVERRD